MSRTILAPRNRLPFTGEDGDAVPGIDIDDEDGQSADGIDFRFLEIDKDGLSPAFDSGPIPGVGAGILNAERLEGVLQDLIACRQLLDSALKDG